MYLSASVTWSNGIAAEGFGVDGARAARLGLGAGSAAFSFGSGSAESAAFAASSFAEGFAAGLSAGGESPASGAGASGAGAGLPAAWLPAVLPGAFASAALGLGGLAGLDEESAAGGPADGVAAGCDGVGAGWLAAEEESGVGDGVPALEAGGDESEDGAAAEGFCQPDISADNPSCRQRRYPKPTASASAIRIRKIFPALLFGSSSSSR